MESENTVTYFLFNDRKGTSRCSFILIYSLTFFELYFLFYLHFAPSLPQTRHYPILFAPFFLFKSPPFPLVYLLLNPKQNSFSTPPQSLCNKGMATLSCNSYDIAPQKQCNCHLKALLLERNSYSFAPQRLCPQPTRA